MACAHACTLLPADLSRRIALRRVSALAHVRTRVYIILLSGTLYVIINIHRRISFSFVSNFIFFLITLWFNFFLSSYSFGFIILSRQLARSLVLCSFDSFTRESIILQEVKFNLTSFLSFILYEFSLNELNAKHQGAGESLHNSFLYI